jgi:site-specific recombinase
MTSLQKFLEGFTLANAETLPQLAALVNTLRPTHAEDADAAVEKLRELCRLLDAGPEFRSGLRRALLDLFTGRRSVLLFATSGIYPETGMMAETLRRLSHKLLPEAVDPVQMKDVFGRIFRRSDARWLEQVPVMEWIALIHALRFDETEDVSGFGRLVEDLLEALRVVSHRIAASGLEPEILRLDPHLENHESPFLAQCEEALAFACRAEQAAQENVVPTEDERHYLVLLEQCRETIERVRRRAQQQGASFHLTFRLRRLRQHLDRAQALIALVAVLGCGEDSLIVERSAELWQKLAVAECRRNDLRRFWRQNLELVALRVTENAGHTGEHYISENRPEYFVILRSAIGGGFIIAFMAASKILIGRLGLAPLTEVLAFCLNYGLGFVLIHMLHFSVATKQPAMTANAIAAAIGESAGRERDLEPLVDLIVRTVRSQLAAIAGNIGLAIPTAMLLALAVHWQTGEHFVSPEKAHHLLAEINPIGSGAIIYAAIAGVCLFLAGLVAGYYDNLCAYNRIPERLLQLSWPARLLGTARWGRFAAYVENNLGALAGNFFFGFMLGGVTGIGILFGLPLDIRHIAFSSAYWGYAMISLDFSVEWSVSVLATLGVLAIGLTNLAVSFYLALSVGLKARDITFGQRWKLLQAIAKRLLRQPREFFLPPKQTSAPQKE